MLTIEVDSNLTFAAFAGLVLQNCRIKLSRLNIPLQRNVAVPASSDEDAVMLNTT
jgi:hypothetical protein